MEDTPELQILTANGIEKMRILSSLLFSHPEGVEFSFSQGSATIIITEKNKVTEFLVPTKHLVMTSQKWIQ